MTLLTWLEHMVPSVVAPLAAAVAVTVVRLVQVGIAPVQRDRSRER